MTNKKITFFIVLLFAFGLIAINAQAVQDCSTDESKCWSDSTDGAGIPNTPVAGKIIKGDITKNIPSFYTEVTKKNSMTGKKYVYFIPADQKPATPCSQVKGDLIKIGFENFKEGTYKLHKIKGDKGPSLQTIVYVKTPKALESSSEQSDVTLVVSELGDTAKGFVSIEFKGGTKVAGTFDAHVCK